MRYFMALMLVTVQNKRSERFAFRIYGDDRCGCSVKGTMSYARLTVFRYIE